MDTTVRNVLLGIFGLFAVHASLEKRISHDATQQVFESFNYTGSVHSTAESRGIFGIFRSDLYAVTINADGLKSERLPFEAYPRSGWKGSIRHLRLHLTNLTLKGLPIDRFDADIPFVKFDIRHAIYHDRILIRRAGFGPASARISTDGLRLFILAKYSKTLSDITVKIEDGKVIIRGKANVLGSSLDITATGELLPREGRYLDLRKPEITLNGKPLSETSTESILKNLNPILDLERDVNLGRYFILSSVEIDTNAIVIHGTATVPEVVKPL